jgi:hypothetical protein
MLTTIYSLILGLFAFSLYCAIRPPLVIRDIPRMRRFFQTKCFVPRRWTLSVAYQILGVIFICGWLTLELGLHTALLQLLLCAAFYYFCRSASANFGYVVACLVATLLFYYFLYYWRISRKIQVLSDFIDDRQREHARNSNSDDRKHQLQLFEVENHKATRFKRVLTEMWRSLVNILSLARWKLACFAV